MLPSRNTSITRRRFIAGGLTIVFCAGSPRNLASDSSTASIRVLETKTISPQTRLYHGWPTLLKRRNRECLLVYSGGRQGHVCPFGRVEIMRSRDQGDNWTWPRVLLDSPLDDRDAGITETQTGALLVTTFTSLAYQPILERDTATLESNPHLSELKERVEAWKSVHNRLSDDERVRELGQWMIRSTDGGITWSQRYHCLVNSPHGPVPLSDGRILYAGKELWTGDKRVGVAESLDDGVNWTWLATIPCRDGDDPANYHELHMVECASGKLLVHIRNHNRENAGETLQSASIDSGKTWSVPRPIGVWGLPSHLLRTQDGKLVMTYGYRRPPYGNQARISLNEGEDWSEPFTLSADGAGGDLGYPSTVELDPNHFLTVWYEWMKGPSNAVLRQARWALE